MKHAKVHDLTIESVGTRHFGEATMVSIRGIWGSGDRWWQKETGTLPRVTAGRPDLQDVLIVKGVPSFLRAVAK